MKKLLLSLMAIAIFSASFSQSKKQMANRIDESSIPKDVLNKDYVLIVKVQYDNKKLVEKFTKIMEEHYTGQFVVVPYKESVDEAYPDTKKYKYILALPGALSKKDFIGKNAEIANTQKGIAATSAWSKHMHMVNRQNLEEFWNTNLSAQDNSKILAYFADRLSGKDGSEDE